MLEFGNQEAPHIITSMNPIIRSFPVVSSMYVIDFCVDVFN